LCFNMVRSPFSKEVIGKFRQGICHLLALELYRKHDWPLYGVVWQGKESIWHVLNQTETGMYIDVLGAYAQKDSVLDYYPPVGNHPNTFAVKPVDKSRVDLDGRMNLDEPLFESGKKEAQKTAERLSSWFYNKVLEE